MEGRVKGCGWFKLVDRARGGDMVDMVINWVARHGECNLKMKSFFKTKMEERRRRRGRSKEGLDLNSFLQR
jgi:hypothetical protein